MNNPTITYRANGEASSFVGRDAVEVFRIAALISALGLEDKGIRMTRRGPSALAIAKRMTGIKSNDRLRQCIRLREMLDEQKAKCEHVTEQAI